MKRRKIILLCILLVLIIAACIFAAFGNRILGPASTVDALSHETKGGIDNGNIEVVSMKGVDGIFVEKGNLDEVKNVVTVEVKNNSARMLEYALLSYKVNGIERAEFEISALPPSESAVVMESFARAYSNDDTFELENERCVFTYCDASEENEDVNIETNGSEISVTNKADAARNVTIVYKYYKDDLYYGGIAFRGKIENISPGETITKNSDRFNDGCRIVNIITEPIGESEAVQ